MVCRFKKITLWWKQSPRHWNRAFSECMESIEFNQSTADPCVYVKIADTTVIFAVYVDDMILTARTSEKYKKLKQVL